jgi:hypothetical protein
MTTIKNGFLMDVILLPLDKILPSRKLKPGVKTSSRYQMIEASVREVVGSRASLASRCCPSRPSTAELALDHGCEPVESNRNGP